ncbi:hypothetical protein K9U39_14170 [Rhodoblastus acidophilus]|uniref:Uncharacterized protein n=1 Tax=Candidatus Rhodoblastus alkanivorans TaxID=2954117 RepID=A0ABS9ZC84_9HYPH|nr:hypothetical protein [Candidatus Rhodoblastus alkanivorans]MCI4677750.1 hypothetical protein [Candidatus Rhodoblastus alkanivorans]MCI4684752.1 hypothetical protein [Candidatus Rhodoblastus alkanivorans]MDI4642075.1 hypothetical protein [Rhodoblastus acidophilus]
MFRAIMMVLCLHALVAPAYACDSPATCKAEADAAEAAYEANLNALVAREQSEAAEAEAEARFRDIEANQRRLEAEQAEQAARLRKLRQEQELNEIAGPRW